VRYARLNEMLEYNQTRVSAIFAWTSLARLSKNSRHSPCVRAQKPEFHAQNVFNHSKQFTTEFKPHEYDLDHKFTIKFEIEQ